MTMTQGAPAPSETSNSDGNDITHLTCCNEDIAICGTDVAGLEWSSGLPEDDELCVVCADPELPCSVCGKTQEELL